MFSRRTNWNLSVNRYTEALALHRREGRELLDLTASNPTEVGLAYPDAEILAAFQNPEMLHYIPIPQGAPAARLAIASYYSEKGITVSPDDLILTTSTSEAYSFVFRLLCDPGDSVLVPTPSYPLFDFLAELNDVRLVPYELVYDHAWQIDFTSIRQAIANINRSGGRCRGVLLVHPNNPTGSYVRPAEMAQLNALCGEYQLAIIADEVFLDYQLDAPRAFSFATNSEVLTFTLSGLSKVSALPQVKVAWLVTNGPEEWKRQANARLEVIADTYLSMNAPVQAAIPRLVGLRGFLQEQLLGRVRQNLEVLDTALSRQKLCTRLAVQGGWYATIRVPALGPDEELAIGLLRDAGVLLQPGHFYNFPSDGYLVASLITPPEEFANGISRALDFIATRCSV